MSTIISLANYYADAGGSGRQDCRQVGISMPIGVENNNADAQLAVSECVAYGGGVSGCKSVVMPTVFSSFSLLIASAVGRFRMSDPFRAVDCFCLEADKPTSNNTAS